MTSMPEVLFEDRRAIVYFQIRTFDDSITPQRNAVAVHLVRLLPLRDTASFAEMAAAHRALARRHHSDNEDDAMTRSLREVHDTLCYGEVL